MRTVTRGCNRAGAHWNTPRVQAARAPCACVGHTRTQVRRGVRTAAAHLVNQLPFPCHIIIATQALLPAAAGRALAS